MSLWNSQGREMASGQQRMSPAAPRTMSLLECSMVPSPANEALLVLLVLAPPSSSSLARVAMRWRSPHASPPQPRPHWGEQQKGASSCSSTPPSHQCAAGSSISRNAAADDDDEPLQLAALKEELAGRVVACGDVASACSVEAFSHLIGGDAEEEVRERDRAQSTY